MKRLLFVLTITALTMALGTTAAHAGSPHFITSAFSAVRTGDTLTVSGKEAGLGDEAQIEVTVSGNAACLNRGGNFPKAANKEAFSTTVSVPVQNGKANYSVDLTFAVSPSCNPPMTLVIGDVTVADVTNGLTFAFPGTF